VISLIYHLPEEALIRLALYPFEIDSGTLSIAVVL